MHFLENRPEWMIVKVVVVIDYGNACYEAKTLACLSSNSAKERLLNMMQVLMSNTYDYLIFRFRKCKFFIDLTNQKEKN